MIIKEPGYYADVSFGDYLDIDAMSQSELKRLKRSPLAFQWYREVTQVSEPTDAMKIGTLIHTQILEPHLLTKEFAVQPDHIKVRRGKAWDEFVAENPGVEIVKAEWCKLARDIDEAITEHAAAHKLLHDEALDPEASLVWRRGSELCKGRVDAWRDNERAIIDIKTSGKPVSYHSFQRHIYNQGYHNQAAWYVEGMTNLGFDVNHYIIVAIETRPPHHIAVYELEPEAIRIGTEENNRLFDKYLECKAEDYWPGYSESVEQIGLPDFVMKEQETNDEEWMMEETNV